MKAGLLAVLRLWLLIVPMLGAIGALTYLADRYSHLWLLLLLIIPAYMISFETYHSNKKD